MYKYQILVEYVGSEFRGWQIQKKGKTIQGLIQEKISKLLKQKILIFGSGRTDTGVHAVEQSAHFECKNQIYHLDKFIKSLNAYSKRCIPSIKPNSHLRPDRLAKGLSKKRSDFS